MPDSNVLEKWNEIQKNIISLNQELDRNIKKITKLSITDNELKSKGIFNTMEECIAKELLQKQQSIITQLSEYNNAMVDIMKEYYPCLFD